VADPGEVSPRQRAVLVLGAGRSGTSIITRAMQATGVELGNDFKPPSRKNPSGYFEDAALLKLSKRLRRTLGLRPDSLRLLDDSVWSSPQVMPYYAEFAATIKERFGHAPIWGFKYARTMRLLPFWVRLFEQMDILPAYVMPVRNPLSVARSRAKLDAHRGRQEHSDLEWLVNVVPYFHQVRGRQLVVMDYDTLMEHPVEQLERMASRLGLPLTDETHQEIQVFAKNFLQRGLQHTRFSMHDLKNSADINVLVREAYGWLDRLARDDIQPTASALWDAWDEVKIGVGALAPMLARMDSLQRELRYAQWNPLSPLPAAWHLAKRLLRR